MKKRYDLIQDLEDECKRKLHETMKDKKLRK